MSSSEESLPVAVIGATGYVGGRLAPRLLEAGHAVRAVGRSASKLACRPWAGREGVSVAEADVMDHPSLAEALSGCRAAFYLVHSMDPSGKDFAERDRKAAANMAEAAEAAGLQRIIYLGGLGEKGESLSHHLKSRHETAEVLRSGAVPVTTLRAAMILGAGSASFEIMRYLVERLPVMVTPRWVHTKCQPVAVSDVLAYLAGCLENPDTNGLTLDIGGPDVLTYRELFDIYAEEAGLPRRRVIPVPVLTPKLSSYWINLVTPAPAAIARPLAEGLRNEVVMHDFRILDLVPVERTPVREAIRTALERIKRQTVETCWSDAGKLLPPEWLECGDAPYAGGTVLEWNYRVRLDCAPDTVWKTLSAIGGENGWFYADFLWRLRGAADKVLGGPGYRRGRRDSEDIRTGDALDFWRVLDADPGRRLMLKAEMRLPGEAVLNFTLEPLPDGGTELAQVSRFLPKGLAGIGYWYAMAPFHANIFKGMLEGVAERSGCKVISGPERFRGGGEACKLPEARP
jgi:uncharacterized protein YbjT (DUF2867 family)/uncharacterized protein YndB with AHSA1/START domain